MNRPALHSFLTAVTQNPELQEKVTALVENPSADSMEQLATLSADAGFPVSAEEWQVVLVGKAEIADNDLASVAGGAWVGGRNVADTLSKLLKERRAREAAASNE